MQKFRSQSQKSPLFYVCVIKKCFSSRTTMGVSAFESSGFRVHSTYFQKLHTTSKKFLELFKVNISLKGEGFSRVDSHNNFKKLIENSVFNLLNLDKIISWISMSYHFNSKSLQQMNCC